ncbi:MAG: SpoIIE family protein phosphatase [Burkholderiales bacterium]
MATVKAPLIEYGVAAVMLAGQPTSGDRHIVKPFAGGVLVAVVDGLGHGVDAGAAADLAVRTLESHAGQPVTSLVSLCHDVLRRSRGAVMSVASFSARYRTMTWLGVGNVEGVLLRRGAVADHCQESLLLRAGVLGKRLPPLTAAVVPVSEGDILILASDGINSAFACNVIVTDRAQNIADRILAGHGKGTDDALVLVSRFLGDGAPQP